MLESYLDTIKALPHVGFDNQVLGVDVDILVMQESLELQIPYNEHALCEHKKCNRERLSLLPIRNRLVC